MGHQPIGARHSFIPSNHMLALHANVFTRNCNTRCRLLFHYARYDAGDRELFRRMSRATRREGEIRVGGWLLAGFLIVATLAIRLWTHYSFPRR